MKYTKNKKGFVLIIIILFINIIFIPNINGNTDRIRDDEYNYYKSSFPLVRRSRDDIKYNPSQSLHPYLIQLNDKPNSGIIESPPEYSSVRGVLFCYISNNWHNVVSDLVVALTQDDQYDDIAYVVVPNTNNLNSATNLFANNGANMTKVEFIVEPVNAIWIRDYGPHFIWQDSALGIVDSNYFQSRHLDNFIPTLIGDDHFIMPTYDIGLNYQGGNFQPGPNRTGFVTSLINLDNPSSQGFDETFIGELFQTYQGVDNLHIMPQMPSNVDGTGHIDMWMYIVDENTIIISEFKTGSNSEAIQITENAVLYFEDLGFEVFRTPAWNANHPENNYWTHWTYTNAFRVNNRIFIPTYGETYSSYRDEDEQALLSFQAAAGPDVEIVQINCYPIIWAMGAIHCIVMQIPRYIDSKPAVNVIYPIGGEILISGTTKIIEWVATDTNNSEIPQIDIYYSIDGGVTYNFINTTSNIGFYNWTIPDDETSHASIKVVALSEDSDQGIGISSDVFQITSSNQTIYDFSTGAGVDKFCYGYQVTDWSKIDGDRTPVLSEITSNDYMKLAISDNNRFISRNPLGGRESTYVYEFNINEKQANIVNIEILWEGYSEQCTQIELYIWDYMEEQWSDGQGLFGQNRFLDNWAGNRDGYLNKHIYSDFDHYIDSNGQITLLLYTERSSIKSLHDYISLTISSSTSNNPPSIPIIKGPTKGNLSNEYSFIATSIDPEGKNIFYLFDWGDNTDTSWIGPFDSGTSINISHNWSRIGLYKVKVKAKDTQDTESDWAKQWLIMPKNKTNSNFTFLNFFENKEYLFPVLRQILGLH